MPAHQFTDKGDIMKRLGLACTVIFIALLYLAVYADRVEVIPFDKASLRVDPGQLHTAKPVWVTIDTTTSAGSEPDDLGVGERTYTQVAALIAAAANDDEEMSVFDIPRGWNSIRLRATGTANDATVTYIIYLGTLGDGNRDIDSTSADCDLSYLGTFAFEMGTQQSTTATDLFAEICITTTGNWTKDITTTSPGENTFRVAEARVDLVGADLLVAIPTVASTNSKLLGKGF